MSTYQNQEITCIQCKIVFDWTKGEQEFMQDLYDKGKLNSEVVAPKRCRDCRLKKKRERENRENQDY